MSCTALLIIAPKRLNELPTVALHITHPVGWTCRAWSINSADAGKADLRMQGHQDEYSILLLRHCIPIPIPLDFHIPNPDRSLGFKCSGFPNPFKIFVNLAPNFVCGSKTTRDIIIGECFKQDMDKANI
jgi:hypothetical protein